MDGPTESELVETPVSQLHFLIVQYGISWEDIRERRKRALNLRAARRYRERILNRIQELEKSVEEATNRRRELELEEQGLINAEEHAILYLNKLAYQLLEQQNFNPGTIAVLFKNGDPSFVIREDFTTNIHCDLPITDKVEWPLLSWVRDLKFTISK